MGAGAVDVVLVDVVLVDVEGDSMRGRLGFVLVAVALLAGCTSSSDSSMPTSRPTSSSASPSAVVSRPNATPAPSSDVATGRACLLTPARFAAAVGPGWSGGSSPAAGICGYRRGPLAVTIGESATSLSPSALAERMATLCRISALKPIRRSSTGEVCAGARVVTGYVLSHGLDVNVTGNRIGAGGTFEVLSSTDWVTLVNAVEKALDALAS